MLIGIPCGTGITLRVQVKYLEESIATTITHEKGIVSGPYGRPFRLPKRVTPDELFNSRRRGQEGQEKENVANELRIFGIGGENWRGMMSYFAGREKAAVIETDLKR